MTSNPLYKIRKRYDELMDRRSCVEMDVIHRLYTTVIFQAVVDYFDDVSMRKEIQRFFKSTRGKIMYEYLCDNDRALLNELANCIAQIRGGENE